MNRRSHFYKNADFQIYPFDDFGSAKLQSTVGHLTTFSTTVEIRRK